MISKKFVSNSITGSPKTLIRYLFVSDMDLKTSATLTGAEKIFLITISLVIQFIIEPPKCI